MNVTEVLAALEATFKQSNVFPAGASYLTHEADMDHEDADVHLPLVEMQPITVDRADRFNTDFLTYCTDTEGRDIGELHEAVWEARIQIDIWTVKGSGYDSRELGHELERYLMYFDAKAADEVLIEPDGTPAEDIRHLLVRESRPADMMTTDMTVRRWRTDILVRFVDVLLLREDDTIQRVDIPSAAAGTSVDGFTIDLNHLQ